MGDTHTHTHTHTFTAAPLVLLFMSSFHGSPCGLDAIVHLPGWPVFRWICCQSLHSGAGWWWDCRQTPGVHVYLPPLWQALINQCPSLSLAACNPGAWQAGQAAASASTSLAAWQWGTSVTGCNQTCLETEQEERGGGGDGGSASEGEGPSFCLINHNVILIKKHSVKGFSCLRSEPRLPRSSSPLSLRAGNASWQIQALGPRKTKATITRILSLRDLHMLIVALIGQSTF